MEKMNAKKAILDLLGNLIISGKLLNTHWMESIRILKGIIDTKQVSH